MEASLPTATFTGNALKRPAQAHVGVLDTGADVYVLMNILFVIVMRWILVLTLIIHGLYSNLIHTKTMNSRSKPPLYEHDKRLFLRIEA